MADTVGGAAAAAPLGRPATGPGHYVRDVVYGALDGVVTTLAVVAGSEGAGLGVRVAAILGIANLVADGLSMGASNYLGLRSELLQTGGSIRAEMPWRHGGATWLAFVAVGAVPLAAYLLAPSGRLWWTGASAVLSLYAVGAARARFLPGGAWRRGAEMVVVGVLAGAAAFGVGALAARLT